MSSYNRVKKALIDQRYRFHIINKLGWYRGYSDAHFLKRAYSILVGKELSLDAPKTFNEKLQWLKLYDRKPLYNQLVDKYAVKSYVSECIGSEYIIPTINVWQSVNDITFENLPNQFVLKCTHDSGSAIVCKDKKALDIESTIKILRRGMNRNLFWKYREWPYKDVRPQIIAEQYLENGEGGLDDYKVHNFNGEPRFILVCQNRFHSSGLTEDFYLPNWEHIEVSRPDHPNAKRTIEKPAVLEKMLELSRILSKNIPFVRTDFYIVNGKIYFGEMTFFPAGGFSPFIPEKWDEVFGSWLQLPSE